MTLAKDLGISEQELQDSINLERLYALISKCRDRCNRCGSAPVAYVNTDKVELVCDTCGHDKPHCKRVGQSKLRSSELDKLEKKFGKSSHASYATPKSIKGSVRDVRRRRNAKKKKIVSSSSESESESTDEKSTISSDSSDGRRRGKKDSKKGKKKRGKGGAKPVSDASTNLWGTSSRSQMMFGSNSDPQSSPMPGIVGMLQQQQVSPNFGWPQVQPFSMRAPPNRPGSFLAPRTMPQQAWNGSTIPAWNSGTTRQPWPPTTNPFVVAGPRPLPRNTNPFIRSNTWAPRRATQQPFATGHNHNFSNMTAGALRPIVNPFGAPPTTYGGIRTMQGGVMSNPFSQPAAM